MGLFSKKQEPLTEEDTKMLLEVLKADKLRWELTFPIPCFDIDEAIDKVTNGKELNSSNKETCVNAIKRFIKNNKGSNDIKQLKVIIKKL